MLLTASAMPALSQQPADQGVADDPNATTPADEIVVTGSVYSGNVATSGARINAEIRNLPLSITSLNKELIDDRELRNIRELADNVAGVTSRASGAAAFGVDFTVRGFQGFGGGIAYNGFRTDGYSPGRDIQNVERVEFLKGPASVLYGASGALSGLVNVVTKTPQRDAFLVVDATGGQYGYGRAGLDANAPLTGNLQVRVNAAAMVAKSLNAFTDISSQTIAPSVAWAPAPGVKLLAEFSYFHGRQPSRLTESRRNYPRLLDLPLRFKLGDHGDFNRNDTYMYHGEASWDVTPHLTLREGLFLDRSYENELDIPGYERDLAGDIFSRNQDSGTGSVRDFSSQSELRWTARLGPTRHKILVGFEHAEQNFGYTGDESQPFPALDLDNPVYGYPTRPRIYSYEGATVTHINAPYVQDFIELGAHWKVLAGIRYDTTTADSLSCSVRHCSKSNDPAVNGSTGKVDENAWSPRVGVVWQPTERTTLYASWSKSFAPQPNVDKSGKQLPPERGLQYEVGLRQDLLDEHRLTLTISAYDLTRRNILEEDPTDFRYYVAVGEQRSKGAEAEIAGKPVKWIDLVGAYSFIHAKVTKSETAITGIPEGARLPEVPRNTASLFAKVALVPFGLPDTSIGAGVYYTGPRPTRDNFYPADPSFTRFGATTRVDLSFYQVVSERLRLQANITNLFNEKIFEPVNQGSRRTLPFTATGGLRVSI